MSFNTSIPTQQTLMFLDPAGPVGIMRYDMIKYPIFQKLTRKLRSTQWDPEEVDVSKDAKDFSKLTEFEQNLITYNIKRQSVLDSKQGSAPGEILGPIASLTDVATYIRKWSESEDVHSESYSHIIRNVYPNPKKVFDEILSVEPILKMANSISEPYDALDYWNCAYKHNSAKYDEYEHKRALWMCLNAVNALEGVRFYVSFACTWAFAELKKMEGNAKIIKLICRDENVHLAGTQNMLKYLPQEDPVFARIQIQMKDQVRQLFIDVVNQEIEWAKFLFKNGSMIGLNAELLIDYVKWIAHKRMTAIGIDSPYQGGSNPLPWTQKWISGDDVQVAPQETEITSYLIGTKKNSDPSQFKGFTL